MGLFAALNQHKSVNVPVAYNVMPLIDHSNGTWVKGSRGEMILSGGFAHHTGVLAVANAGKTALGLFMWAMAVRRYPSSTGIIYEDEGTLQIDRVNSQANALLDGVPFDMTDTSEDAEEVQRLMMIDGTSLYLDPFYDMLESECSDRFKQRGVKKYTVTLPWVLNAQRGNSMVKPLFIFIDSASEANVTSAGKGAAKSGIDASEANTEFMREGLVKTKIYGGRMIALGTRGDMCVISTASLDDAGPAMSSMPGAQPEKQMGHLSNKKKMKQLGTSYKKRTSNLWQFGQPHGGFKGTATADKLPKYPLSRDELYLGNKDLEYVAVQNLRGKNGASGVLMNIWRSQTFGVLPDITNLEFIRSWGAKEIRDYGINPAGNHQYSFEFLPDLAWRNTNVRPMFNADRRLRRAAELLVGMKFEFFATTDMELVKYRCTPKELYEDIKALGYDWDDLLNTRGYWMFNEDEANEVPYLSIYDLLRIRAGEYKPYWMD